MTYGNKIQWNSNLTNFIKTDETAHKSKTQNKKGYSHNVLEGN